MNVIHTPVLTQEVLKFLNCEDKKVYLDCTIGTGGHTEAILKKIEPDGQVIGIDKDGKVLELVGMKLIKYKNRLKLIQGNFKNLKQILLQKNVTKIDGILFDLGISSFQLDDKRRGFSFKLNGPLDMRMNQNDKITAYDILNKFKEQKIEEIIRIYGEERFSRKIAKTIVQKRILAPITTTEQLVDIIRKTIGSNFRYNKLHFATRTFQAIRIAVNDEIETLKKGLLDAIEILDVGGRICTIAYHSLEDRVIKNTFKKLDCIQIITKKPIRPQKEEIIANHRARSAKLRAAVKIEKF